MWNLIGSGKLQWNNIFRHNGPMFPSEYKKHNIPIKFKDQEVILPLLAEEYATMFAKYINTPYNENSKFRKNFFIDFKKVLPNELSNSNIDDFDFTLINNHINKINEINKTKTKEEKQRGKEFREEMEKPYKYILIDNINQKVGNYKIEPPGIFLGRGNHPKIGRIKKRIFPKDITLNLDKDADIPKINLSGEHRWKEIIHDKTVVWLATWKDNILGKNKYIFTSMDSIFKSKSDEDKFNLARKLKKKINMIRNSYTLDLTNENDKKKQLATSLYFIDNLALRVGGKKDSKEEADTVGVTSLRVEHLTLIPPNIIKLDFLGKDSIRYCKKISVVKPIYDNLMLFTTEKNKKEQLFDLITPSTLNEYLEYFMQGLTAKVFRTYNASYAFQKELDKVNEDKIKKYHENDRINYLLSMFNQANATVAVICNHQKNVSSNSSEQINKINEKIKLLKKKKKKYQEKKKKDFVTKIESKIKLEKIKKENKSMMKNISLGTSKTNYIDPRIIFAFIKKYKIPPEKLFTKILLERFEWASNVDDNFRF